MAVTINATRRIDQLTNTTEGSDDDLMLIRLSNGSGTKCIRVGDLKNIFSGSAEGLETKKKDTLVNAINEVFGETKTINTKIEPLVYNSAAAHNAICRGKNLGSRVTAKQAKAIQDGTFEDIYPNDYWFIDNKHFRVYACDPYLGTGGGTKNSKHHVVVIPDESMGVTKMNATATTDGGYIGSDMYKTGLAAATSKIKDYFGDNLLTMNLYLSNAVSGGKVAGGAWTSVQVVLPTEAQLTGNRAVSAPTVAGSKQIENSQLPLFAYRPELAYTQWCALRDVVSATQFAKATSEGTIVDLLATDNVNIRPIFFIG